LLKLFRSVRPFRLATAARDAVAGLTLAAMNIPQALGYTKIAGMPVVTGLYSLLLPAVAFAAFGSSRYLVVSADSATAAIFAGGVSPLAAAASPRYVALAGAVALLTAGFLLLARLLKLGFIADFLSQTVLSGFLTGVGFQVGIAVLGEMLGVPVSARGTISQFAQVLRRLPQVHPPTVAVSITSPLCAQGSGCADRGCRSHDGERPLELQRARYCGYRAGCGGPPALRVSVSQVEGCSPVGFGGRIVCRDDHHPECGNGPGLCGAP
jgi:MFS superfamily sulfate permease-like transporter